MSFRRKKKDTAALLDERRGPMESSALQWFIAILITAVLFAGVLWDNEVYFVTNDDASMLKTFAGMAWGTPSPKHKFCNYCFGMLMAALYNAVPGIQWYTYTHFALLFVASSALIKSILGAMARRKHSVFLSITVSAALCLIAFGHQVRYLQFTTTSGTAVGAAAVLFLATTHEVGWLSRFFSGLVCTFLILVGYGMRPTMGKGMLVYFLPAALFKLITAFLSSEKGHVFGGGLKKMIAPVCFALVIASVIYGMNAVNAKYQTEDELDSYIEYTSYRVKYMDYPTLSYQDDPEFYQSIGWTYELYSATRSWYFLDSRYNTESLKAITDRYNGSDKYTVDRTPENIVEKVKTVVFDDLQGFTLTAFNVLLTVFMFFGLIHRIISPWTVEGKQRARMWFALLLALGTTAGSALLCLYLGYQGRFLNRVYYPFAITNAAMLAVFLAELPDFIQSWSHKKKSLTVFSAATRIIRTCAVIVIILLVAAVPMKKVIVADGTTAVSRKAQADRLGAVTEYVAEHRENIYVYSSSLSGDRRTYLHGECSPGNMLFWGGSGMFSKGFYEGIKEHFGLDELHTETLLNDNVYLLLTYNEASPMSQIRRYFDSLGNVQCIEYEDLGCGVKVMKLIEK